MLKFLSIKNFALIENCEIDFSNGLNIISGETGAGKSILIQALTILLGERATVDHIRSGMEEAVLSATIEVPDRFELFNYLKDIGISVDNNELIFRRVLTSSGKSRSFINGVQVTSKEVNVVSNSLFDFHGQNEGISLLRKTTHLKYLDSFLHIDNEISNLNKIYNELKKTIESIKFLEDNEKDKEKRLELLNHEIEEIERTNIKDNEDEELKNEVKVYENIEKIISSLEDSYAFLIGESGINYRLRQVKNFISQVSEMDKSFNNVANDISDVFYKMEDITHEIQLKKDSYDYSPGKLDKLIERSENIEKLKRKYGGTIQKIREYLKKAKDELKLIQFSGEEHDKLNGRLEQLRKEFLLKALVISKKREDGAMILERKVKEQLNFLAMNNIEFNIKIERILINDENENVFLVLNGNKIKYNINGIDTVEFLISPNKGEPLKSLIKIASGGELSRIILALKSILVENDFITTMIFDEIDAGIGGKVGISVGKALMKLGKYKQIICITHLAQIAAGGFRNFLIQKKVYDNRTVSTIEILKNEGKINEIARMLSGQITEISLNHAKELIKSMEN